MRQRLTSLGQLLSLCTIAVGLAIFIAYYRDIPSEYRSITFAFAIIGAGNIIIQSIHAVFEIRKIWLDWHIERYGDYHVKYDFYDYNKEGTIVRQHAWSVINKAAQVLPLSYRALQFRNLKGKYNRHDKKFVKVSSTDFTAYGLGKLDGLVYDGFPSADPIQQGNGTMITCSSLELAQMVSDVNIPLPASVRGVFVTSTGLVIEAPWIVISQKDFPE